MVVFPELFGYTTCIVNLIEKLIMRGNSLKLNWQYKGQPLKGLAWAYKVFAADGTAAWATKSKLDCDCDGLRDESVDWSRDSTRQSSTTLDPANKFFCPNKIAGSVSPLTHPLEIGTVGTAFFNGTHCHFVVHDRGPREKFGEGTPYLLRMLGRDPVRNGEYHDVGIDAGVFQLFYIGVKMPKGPFTQADVNKLAEPLFQKFLNS